MVALYCLNDDMLSLFNTACGNMTDGQKCCINIQGFLKDILEMPNPCLSPELYPPHPFPSPIGLPSSPFLFPRGPALGN